MAEELIERNDLLKRISLQNGIYGMSVNEVIEFIKQEKVVESNLQRENDELTEENEELEGVNGELENRIGNLKLMVENASSNFNREEFIESINDAIN